MDVRFALDRVVGEFQTRSSVMQEAENGFQKKNQKNQLTLSIIIIIFYYYGRFHPQEKME